MPMTNGGHRHQEQIGPQGAGLTVAGHLAQAFHRSSEAEWRRRIQEGEVWLDQGPAGPEDILKAGQVLAWERPPWVEPEVPLATAILHEDAHLLAVAKPSGLPTLPGGGVFQDHTLLALVRRRHPEATPMHRLGRATSGVVLFAPTHGTCARLQAAFQLPATRKVYRALCSGVLATDHLELQAPIGEIPYAPLGRLHAATPGGRAASSRVSVVEAREECTLVDVEIRTGRPHQIRIHLAWAGHPLVGDPLFGPGGVPRPGCAAVPGDPGYLLHAHRLELVHPASGQALVLTCPPPPRLRVAGRATR